MNCRKFHKHCLELLNDLPESAIRNELALHRDTCPECAQYLQGLTQTLSALRPSRSVTASPGLRMQILHKVAQADQRNQNLRPQAGKKESIIMSIIRSSFSHKIRWAVSAVVVVLIVAFVIGLNPFERSSAGVYAAVVEQLKKARTMVYKVTSNVQASMPSSTSEVSYKEPAHVRMVIAIGDAKTYSIADYEQKKAISVIPSKKKYMEMDLSKVPSTKSPMNEIDEMKSLPDRAQELSGEKVVDGRTCKGFQITERGLNKTMWVDASTHELIRMEGDFINSPGLKMVITDFKFDVDLDDSLFDMTPPTGYEKLNVDAQMAMPTEEKLVAFLDWWSTKVEEGLFPDSLSVLDFSKKVKELAVSGKLKKDENYKNLTEEQRMQDVLQRTSGLTFVMMMKPENDWHYAGKGVKLGEADKAIFWYRPTGSQNYRVIYGDLSVREVTPDKLPASVPNAQPSATPSGFPTPPAEMNPVEGANPLQPGAPGTPAMP